MEKILGFFDEYRFLSNFDSHKDVVLLIDDLCNGHIPCETIEHAFQALKTLDPAERLKIAHASTPGKAKRLGKSCSLRPDWQEIKIDTMFNLVAMKFSQIPYKEMLLATGDAYLEETNTWGDTFWGVCEGVGENHLGLILMQVRDYMKP